MLSFYQSNVTQYLNLKVDARLRLHQTRVAGLRTDRHRRLVEEELALVVHEPAPVRPLLYFEIPAWSIIHLIESPSPRRSTGRRSRRSSPASPTTRARKTTRRLPFSLYQSNVTHNLNY